MRVLILAGGKGKRLLPLTKIFPKPMIPIGSKPIVEILIEQLISYGFHDIIMAVGHLSHLIRTYFHGKYSNGTKLSYINEHKPLGTAGALAVTSPLGEAMIVVNGDVLTELNFRDLVNYHLEQKAIITVAVCQKQVKVDFGSIITDEKQKIVAYNEKPALTYNASMGIYVCSPKVWDYLEPHKHLDIPTLVHSLLQAGEHVLAYPYHGYWRDIGTTEEYELAVQDYEAKRAIFASPQDVNPNLVSNDVA